MAKLKKLFENKYAAPVILIIAALLLILGFPKDQSTVDPNQRDSSLSNTVSGVIDPSQLNFNK